jgi:hypothetical protein
MLHNLIIFPLKMEDVRNAVLVTFDGDLAGDGAKQSDNYTPK